MSGMDCSSGKCGCGGGGLTRRELVKVAGIGAAAAMLAEFPVMAGPFVTADFEKLIPSDKKLKPEWLASLFARGEAETFRGRDLWFIGMPVGGLFCGTLYLGGDGRLWLWDIFNKNQSGIFTEPVNFRGQQLIPNAGGTYVQPARAEKFRTVEQGFTIQMKTAGGTVERSLDADGFADVTFTGQYPIGVVRYVDPALPVQVMLEAFSPFIPLNADDSSLPVTVFAFQLKNTSNERVDVELTGLLENAACRGPQYWNGTRRNSLIKTSRATILQGDVVPRTDDTPERDDIVFEDWSKPEYAGWEPAGTAFGRGTIRRAEIPQYQGDVGGPGERVVNSHASAPAESVGGKDGATGKLTSKPFTVSRRFINLWVGGGEHAGRTCVNLVVEGKIERSETGRNENRMSERAWSVREFEGKQAVIEIVDAEPGAWGNIGVGRISFSDRPAGAVAPEQQGDFGTMALALLGKAAEISSGELQVELERKLVGRLGRQVSIEAGATAEITFAIAWHFPNVHILEKNRRHYAARFKDAANVARYVAENQGRLVGQTRLWRDTWYDSSLPHWFLNRTFANTANLATTTCHRFENGRFWAWEGVGCCAGTCTHVWHYAQALARLFPEVERDQRERVDFGLALREDGTIRFRAEHNNDFAADGQAGRILGVYREHQTSRDNAFLKRIWPKVKLATQRLMQADPKRDGMLRGPLHNTLDADWFGYVPWLCGLYHAALRAAEEMAGAVGEVEFAKTCRAILDVAARNLDTTCWSEDYQYYIHRGDAEHASIVGAYEGCHIDQVFGQSWAWQVGLGPIMTPARVRAALKSIWKYNFTPDVGTWREAQQAGRWYALAGDGGTIMVTYPFGSARKFEGAGAGFAGYFNECMSGFEHQAASHMMWEGMVTEALACTRVIHDRYHPRLRNPYNEVECSDHYARAMASYGTYLAACGFEYDGPTGRIGFAPRMKSKAGEGSAFRAAFTAAQGWGTFDQAAEAKGVRASIAMKWGELRLKSLSLTIELPPSGVRVLLDGNALNARVQSVGGRCVVTLEADSTIKAGQRLEVTVEA